MQPTANYPLEKAMPNRIHFDCPACNAHVKAKTRNAGQRLVCPKCRTEIQVPYPGDAPGDVPDLPPDPHLRSAPETIRRKWVWLAGAAAVLLIAAAAVTSYWLWFSTPRLKVRDCFVDSSYRVVNQDEVPQPEYAVLRVEVEDIDWKDRPPKAWVVGSDGSEWEWTWYNRWNFDDPEGKGTAQIDLDLFFPIPSRVIEVGGLKLKYEEFPTVTLPSNIRSWTKGSPNTWYQIKLAR